MPNFDRNDMSNISITPREFEHAVKWLLTCSAEHTQRIQCATQLVTWVADSPRLYRNFYCHPTSNDIRRVVYNTGLLAQEGLLPDNYDYSWLVDLASYLQFATHFGGYRAQEIANTFAGLGMLAFKRLLPATDYSFLPTLVDELYQRAQIANANDLMLLVNGFFFGAHAFVTQKLILPTLISDFVFLFMQFETRIRCVTNDKVKKIKCLDAMHSVHNTFTDAITHPMKLSQPMMVSQAGFFAKRVGDSNSVPPTALDGAQFEQDLLQSLRQSIQR